MYMDTNTDHFTPLALHVRGKDCATTIFIAFHSPLAEYVQIIVVFFFFLIVLLRHIL